MPSPSEEGLRAKRARQIQCNVERSTSARFFTMTENGYSVRDIDMTNWFTYYRTGEPAARAKVVLDADKKLVGATVLSAHADELINYFTEAINNKDGYQAIRDRLYAYPTPASDLEYFF